MISLCKLMIPIALTYYHTVAGFICLRKSPGGFCFLLLIWPLFMIYGTSSACLLVRTIDSRDQSCCMLYSTLGTSYDINIVVLVLYYCCGVV